MIHEKLSPQSSLIEEGQVFSHDFVFTQQDVNDFARITGDDNPIHVDAAYAAATPFKRPIIHGFLSGTAFSKVLGKYFPGEGSIYISQSMQFMRPMFVEHPYQVVFTVLHTDRAKHRATFKTEIIDQESGKKTIVGEAVVMHPERI